VLIGLPRCWRSRFCTRLELGDTTPFSCGRFRARRALASSRIRSLERENGKGSAPSWRPRKWRVASIRGYKQVYKSLGDMQSQIARLIQDCRLPEAWCSRIRSSTVEGAADANRPETVSVNSLEIRVDATGSPRAVVAGTAVIAVEGCSGATFQPDFGQVTPNRRVQPGILLPLLSGL